MRRRREVLRIALALPVLLVLLGGAFLLFSSGWSGRRPASEAGGPSIAPRPAPAALPGTGGLDGSAGPSAAAPGALAARLPEGEAIQDREPIEGQVVNEDGKAIEGASLRLRPLESRGEGPLELAARTDGQGRFRFRAVPAGPALLSARAEGRRSLQGFRVEPAPRAPVRLVLVPDLPALVRVADGEGRPLAGVEVVARVRSAAPEIPLLSPLRARSGPDGEAELHGLPADDGTVLAVRATLAGRPPATLRATAGALRARPLLITLERGETLGGKVVGPGGELLADVRLVLFRAAREPEELFPFHATINSTATGAFRFTGLEPGEYDLFADGGERGRRRLAVRIDRRGGGEEIEVELFGAGTAEAESAIPPPPPVVARPLGRSGGSGLPGSGGAPGIGGAPGTGAIHGRVLVPEDVAYAIGLQRIDGDGAPERVYRQSGRRSDFSLFDVDPGSYRLLLIVSGQVRARTDTVVVEAGGDAGPVELRLE
jgi:hypothetical protein